MKNLGGHTNPRLGGWNLPPEVQQTPKFYRVMRKLCQIFIGRFWQVRVFGRHHEPTEGGVLLVCNHQSFLDPMLATMALRRPGNYMARDTLFRNRYFCKLIESVGTFPVRRGSADMGAMKEAMRRLRGGGTLLLFPEGTRTRDGRIGPLLPGMSILARKAAKWTVPVVIDGAFEGWPRSQKFPGLSNVSIVYGKPISSDEIRKLPPHEWIDGLRDEMIRMQTDLRIRMGRKPFDYDKKG